MWIQNLIKKYFESGPTIWDINYRPLPVGRLQTEYNVICQYLLTNYNVGDRIAIGLSRNYRYLLTLLACMDTGVVFVPLRQEWPSARIKQIQEIVQFKTFFSEDLVSEIIETSETSKGKNSPLPLVAPDQPLYCLFTSGTAGMPKGVMIHRKSYENFLRWSNEFFKEIGPQDRLLNSTDYTFDVVLAEIAIALTRKPGFFCSRFQDDIFTLLNELHELKITTIATVPNNFMMLLDERWIDRADLSSLRHALIAGARFPLALDLQFKKFLPHTLVYNCYGPTEATIYCLARLLDGKDNYVDEQTVSVGSAISGCLPLIVDEQMKPVPAMHRGELLMGGIQVMDSYINNPTATDKAIVEIEGIRYYKTGDLAFYNSNGDFFITGRNDDTIKVSGQRVNLSDIDGYVQKLDDIKSCATIAIEDKVRGAFLVLFIVPFRQKTKKETFDSLREILPRHQLPQDILILEKLPINNSGKICKKTLKHLFLEKRSVK